MRLRDIAEKHGLSKLDSATKYPSILTYHEMGERGCLNGNLSEGKSFEALDEVFVTEKIDGTNARMIFYGGDYFIGSRDDLLYAKGDLFGDKTLGIIDVLKPVANRICDNFNDSKIHVVFGEVYGGGIGKESRQYTSDKSKYGFRVFDIIETELADFEKILSMDIEKIASWREHGGQRFVIYKRMRDIALNIGVETTPFIGYYSSGEDIPIERADVHSWLNSFYYTQAEITHVSNGRAEGVVVRNHDRSLIRKMRFEDYERTKRNGGF